MSHEFKAVNLFSGRDPEYDYYICWMKPRSLLPKPYSETIFKILNVYIFGNYSFDNHPDKHHYVF